MLKLSLATMVKGVSVKDGDLNKDDIVDEKDIRFVEKNFLKKGPDASKSQTPVEKSKSGTLADILKKLGLTPKNNNKEHSI